MEQHNFEFMTSYHFKLSSAYLIYTHSFDDAEMIYLPLSDGFNLRFNLDAVRHWHLARIKIYNDALER